MGSTRPLATRTVPRPEVALPADNHGGTAHRTFGTPPAFQCKPNQTEPEGAGFRFRRSIRREVPQGARRPPIPVQTQPFRVAHSEVRLVSSRPNSFSPERASSALARA
jgi:hypothetical protein